MRPSGFENFLSWLRFSRVSTSGENGSRRVALKSSASGRHLGKFEAGFCFPFLCFAASPPDDAPPHRARRGGDSINVQQWFLEGSLLLQSSAWKSRSLLAAYRKPPPRKSAASPSSTTGDAAKLRHNRRIRSASVSTLSFCPLRGKRHWGHNCRTFAVQRRETFVTSS